MSKKCSLLTGGAGFIGSHLCRELLALGHEVVVLDDLSGGFEENVPAGAKFVEGSIVDHELVSELFAEHKFNYVYHLAAYAAEGLSHFIRRYNYSNNLIGSMNLINESVKHDVECFVFTSSIAVYGEGQVPLRESTTPAPEDPYGVAKYAVEMDLAAAKKQFGLNSIIFRPHNVYGEFQNIGDRYRNVIGIFMNQSMDNEAYTIFGDGEQTRAFTYIGDVAPIIASSVDNPKAYNETYNIGADQPYSVNELAHSVAAAMGVEGGPQINYLEARNEVLHAYSDHSKIKSHFDHCEPTSLEEGIEKMAKWALSVGSRKTEPFAAIEVDQGMPPSWKAELQSTPQPEAVIA